MEGADDLGAVGEGQGSSFSFRFPAKADLTECVGVFRFNWLRGRKDEEARFRLRQPVLDSDSVLVSESTALWYDFRRENRF